VIDQWLWITGAGRLLPVRLLKLLVTPLVTLVGALAPVGEAQASAAWQLLDYHPNSCVTVRGGSEYYGIYISGSWAHQIDLGAADLPASATSWSSYAPIPPGSSDGVYSLAYVAVAFPANLPPGTVTVSVWADDGTDRQSVQWTLRVQTRCGY
jgi:subtilisin family serine protease